MDQPAILTLIAAHEQFVSAVSTLLQSGPYALASSTAREILAAEKAVKAAGAACRAEYEAFMADREDDTEDEAMADREDEAAPPDGAPPRAHGGRRGRADAAAADAKTLV